MPCVFRLGPQAACGDLISAPVRLNGEEEKVEQTFVIKKVSYRYQYERGAYRMTGKAAVSTHPIHIPNANVCVVS